MMNPALEGVLAGAFLAVVYAVGLAALFGLSRIFVRGWAAFFMAVVMSAFGCTLALIAALIIDTAAGSRQSPWAMFAVALAVGVLGCALGGSMFARWHRRVLASRVSQVF